jgi:glutamyl-tRNA reductase
MTSIAVIGVSHITAPVDIRELFAFTDKEAVAVLGGLQDHSGIKEAVLISTCNRTELYLCPGSDPDILETGEAVLSEKAGDLVGGAGQYIYRIQGLESVRHLFRVVSGLDSLILGEAEIQGQVRSAYELAGSIPTTPPLAGPVLHRLFQTSFSVGGQIRSSTPIGEGAGSVASVAVKLARKIFGDLDGRQIMILGSGTMAELAVEAMKRDHVVGLVVANQKYERAQKLAERLSGKTIPIDEMLLALDQTDILVASTAAPHTLVTLDDFRDAVGGSRKKPILILDLAIPRDVEAEIGDEDNVFLYNVDDVREIVDGNLIKRQASVVDAEAIVQNHAETFAKWHDARDVVPLIKGLRSRWGDLRKSELEWLWQRLSHLSEEDREIVDSFSKRLLNKLMHEPTTRLKDGVVNGLGSEFISAVRYLHALEDVDLDHERNVSMGDLGALLKDSPEMGPDLARKLEEHESSE